MNLAREAFDRGLLHDPQLRAFPSAVLDPIERAQIAAEVLEGIEEFRRSLPWWKRWTYCIGAAIADLKDLTS